MKLTEQEIDKAIYDAINEYDNWNYPVGADADPRAPWRQSDPLTDSEEYDYPMPTLQLLIYVATEMLDINDREKLFAIKEVAEKLPQEVYVYGKYSIPFEWERDEDGGYRNFLYEEAETIDLATCVKEGNGNFVYLPKWVEQHQLASDPETLELIKTIISTFDKDLSDNNVGPEDFERDGGYLEDFENYIKRCNVSEILGVVNESTMKNIIYKRVIKALDECCK